MLAPDRLPLPLAEVRFEDGTALLTPGGDLDVTTAHALSAQLADILARLPEYVVRHVQGPLP